MVHTAMLHVMKCVMWKYSLWYSLWLDQVPKGFSYCFLNRFWLCLTSSNIWLLFLLHLLLLSEGAPNKSWKWKSGYIL